MQTIDDVLRQAAALRSHGRLDMAAKLLADTLRNDASAHAISFQLAVLSAEQENWSDAERLARSAAALGGDSYATGLGQILATVGKFAEAEEWLCRALALNARDAEALVCLGSVHVHRKKFDDGLACIEAALLIQPGFTQVRKNRDRMLVLRESYGKARRALEEYARHRGLDTEAIQSTTVEFPTAFGDANGNPRFTLSLPGSLIVNDLGAALLFQHEVAARGWEFPLRKFLDRQLRSDDVFIDAGAHWGIHSLTAATTRWSNQVSVLAIEAHPENVERLRSWVARNQVQETVEVISTALGDREGFARLKIDGSSMGHSLRNAANVGSPTIEIAVTTLDSIIADRMPLRWRRLILKIDVEGYEYEVLLGARQLLASGNVAAVIWENGEFYERKVLFERRRAVLDLFNSYGFAHYRFEGDGEDFISLSTLDEACDVYSLSPDLRVSLACAT